MDKQTPPRQYVINSEQLKDIMKYLMTRPYAEVVTIMNSLATLTPVNSDTNGCATVVSAFNTLMSNYNPNTDRISSNWEENFK